MSAVELLRECQGKMSIGEFARHLGIGRSTLSMIYRGQRNPGRLVLKRLAEKYPERREEIAALFLSPNGHDSYPPIAIATVKEQAP